MSAGSPTKDHVRPPDDYASYAWLLIGLLGTVAGWLDLHDGHLRFSTAEKVEFDVPLEEVTDVVFPWYYSGGGVKLSAAGEPYRISFVLPNGTRNAVAPETAPDGMEELNAVWEKAGETGAGRRVGKEWRRRLGGTAKA